MRTIPTHVSELVMAVSSVQTDEPIEMRFGRQTRVDQGTAKLYAGCILAPPGEYSRSIRMATTRAVGAITVEAKVCHTPRGVRRGAHLSALCHESVGG